MSIDMPTTNHSLKATKDTKDCGCGGGMGRVIALLLIAGALVLALIAGLFFAGLFIAMLFLPHAGQMGQAAAAPAVPPPVLPMLNMDLSGGLIGFLLIVVAVLLVLILIMLAILLFCFCRGMKHGIPLDIIKVLIALVPHIRDIGPAIRAAVTALNASSAALGVLKRASDLLGEVTNVTGGTVDVWQKGNEIAAMFGFYSIQNQTEAKSVAGFGDVITAISKVQAAGELLRTPPVGLSEIEKAKDAVDTASRLLDPIATALGSPPPA